jgi:hypothetical protein
MRTNFDVPGLMEMETPRADDDAIRQVAYLDMQTDIITWGETYDLFIELKDVDGNPIAMNETYSVACRVSTSVGGEAIAEPVMTIADGVATGTIDTGDPAYAAGTYYYDIRITYPDNRDEWSDPVRLILEDRTTPPA